MRIKFFIFFYPGRTGDSLYVWLCFLYKTPKTSTHLFSNSFIWGVPLSKVIASVCSVHSVTSEVWQMQLFTMLICFWWPWRSYSNSVDASHQTQNVFNKMLQEANPKLQWVSKHCALFETYLWTQSTSIVYLTILACCNYSAINELLAVFIIFTIYNF